jgi:hypothetical protein
MKANSENTKIEKGRIIFFGAAFLLMLAVFNVDASNRTSTETYFSKVNYETLVSDALVFESNHFPELTNLLPVFPVSAFLSCNENKIGNFFSVVIIDNLLFSCERIYFEIKPGIMRITCNTNSTSVLFEEYTLLS